MIKGCEKYLKTEMLLVMLGMFPANVAGNKLINIEFTRIYFVTL